MAEQLVPDEVWSAISRCCLPSHRIPKGGRPCVENRAVLGRIIYVLRAGVPWRLLTAKELGCGSGVTDHEGVSDGILFEPTTIPVEQDLPCPSCVART
jgi:hypothetical protein